MPLKRRGRKKDHRDTNLRNVVEDHSTQDCRSYCKLPSEDAFDRNENILFQPSVFLGGVLISMKICKSKLI